MHRIILVRHGEPDLPISEKIRGREIPLFLEAYNKAPLKPSSHPSDKLIYYAQNATVFCSDLPRSLASAKRCSVIPKRIDPLFAESIPPHFQSHLLRLRPKTWLILSRMLWMGGFSLHGESLSSTRQRAVKATEILVGEAKKRDTILFGHGLFNIMIARELLKKGFKGPKVPARDFWDYGIYKCRNQ